MKTYIAEKLAILDAATPGPWEVRHCSGHLVAGDTRPNLPCNALRDKAGNRVLERNNFGSPNAAFIADSRNHRRAELEVIGMLWDALEEADADFGSMVSFTGATPRISNFAAEARRRVRNAMANVVKKLETP